MLEEKRLEHLMDTGYKVQQVNLYFTADPNPDRTKIAADIKSWRITMHIKSLKDYGAMANCLATIVEDYLDEQLFDSDVQALRIGLVWEKDEDFGKSVEFCDCIVRSSFEMKEVSDQIMKLSWL